jgi:ribosome maturation factor RimP
MIDRNTIEAIVSSQLDPEKEFIVELTISSGNQITVLIDSDKGITIDRCVKVSRAIEENFDREVEDFELEVSSAGLSTPFKVVRQYQKNLGRELDVVLNNGQKVRGKLLSASDFNIVLEIEEMVKQEGQKRKDIVIKQLELLYTDIKSAMIVISFR